MGVIGLQVGGSKRYTNCKRSAYLATGDCPTGPYFHERQKCVLSMGDLEDMICVKMRCSCSKRRAILIRAKGMLVRALCLSGSIPKFLRREIRGFISEISVRNQSTKQCCMRNSLLWAPFTGVAAGETRTGMRQPKPPWTETHTSQGQESEQPHGATLWERKCFCSQEGCASEDQRIFLGTP